MDTCATCGHDLGGGRFCTKCGRPRDTPPPATAGVHDADATRQMPAVTTAADDDWRTDTAERPAVPDATHHTHRPGTPPPPAAPVVAGDGPRFPLFADQVPADEPGTPTERSRVLPPAPAPAPAVDGTDRPRRDWLPWVAVGAAALLLVAVLGGWMLLGGSSSQPPADAHGGRGSAGAGGSGGAGGPSDVAREATAQVPATAPPNQDLDGNMVRYEARNMLDGVPTTCWRMAGDGTGDEITFDLARPTTLTTVGLINGYAKTAVDARGHELDWYHGNRRVLSVEWTFDDGTTVTQDLTDTTRMQTVKVDHVTTQHVRLRLVSVSAPGRGPAARDYTPISDVTLQGSAG